MTTTQATADSGLTQTDYAQGITTVFSAISQIRAARFNAKQLEASAAFAREQAEASLSAGLSEASLAIGEGRRLVSRQRAQLAGAGIDIGVGTAADIQEETEIVAAENARRQIQAASMRAYGFEVQAGQQELRADMERTEGISRATGTLLTGIGEFESRRTQRRIINSRSKG